MPYARNFVHELHELHEFYAASSKNIDDLVVNGSRSGNNSCNSCNSWIIFFTIDPKIIPFDVRLKTGVDLVELQAQ